jgi:hypothetical protein
MLGRPRAWRRLRRWAHMLGFGGHFLTKSRRYSITFALLRNNRVEFRRVQAAGPERTRPGAESTTLVVNFLRSLAPAGTPPQTRFWRTRRRRWPASTPKPPGKPSRPLAE